MKKNAHMCEDLVTETMVDLGTATVHEVGATVETRPIVEKKYK